MRFIREFVVIGLSVVGVIFSACSGEEVVEENKETDQEETIEEYSWKEDAFTDIIDTSGLEGCILVLDENNRTYYTNNREWSEKGWLPASTFKIPNSMIALELGTLESDTSVIKWDGEDRRLDIWEQDLTLRDAFQYSCLPCYQDLSRRAGMNKMREMVDKLGYPGMVFDGTDFDKFWVEGKSSISCFEQIQFLKNYQQGKLPISERTDTIFRKVFVVEETDEYTYFGKTGWSVQGEVDNGWYVGMVERSEGAYFFATNVCPLEDYDMKNFPRDRVEITLSALNELEILN